jgi:hypothetical protein
LVVLATVPTGAAQAADQPFHRDAGELSIYIGLIPAHAAGQRRNAEQLRHGGSGTGEYAYHLTVAVFDRKGDRVEDAQVSATVVPLGLAGHRRKLEPMRLAETVTYGGYFELAPTEVYRIDVEVVRAGTTAPARASFDYRRNGRARG